MSKRIFYLMLVLAVFVISITPLAAVTQTKITIQLNGKVLTFDSEPRNMNGRTLVPITSLAKELGAITEWNPETKSVTITLLSKTEKRTIYLKIGQAVALVDGVEVKMDTPAAIYENRTFVPLRFISENFGAKVDWEEKTRTIKITYDPPEQEEPPMIVPPWELEK